MKYVLCVDVPFYFYMDLNLWSLLRLIDVPYISMDLNLLSLLTLKY
jgi:predicted protein tyrosine phosphatase